MQRFSFKLNVIIITISAIILTMVGIYVGRLMDKDYISTISSHLTRESAVVSAAINSTNVLKDPTNQKLQDLVNQFAKPGGERITIVTAKGVVLADTEADPKTMENHSDRPEIREALSGGSGYSIRFSKTIGKEMIYVAHVLGKNKKNPIGVVRISLLASQINQNIHSMWYTLIAGMASILFITVIVSFLVSRQITRPIEEITMVADQIAHKKYQSRVHIRAEGEVGQLANSINYMAASLELQMNAIKENEQKLAGVLHNMVSGIILIGQSRRILLANSAIEVFLGYSEVELLGKLHIEAGMNFVLSQLIDRCFTTGDKIREEVHVYYPSERILDTNLAPYLTEHGEVKGVVVVLHDISAIRRLEKMRSEFVANVSHELKTPVTSIKGFAETLLDGAMEDKELLRNFLEIIYKESDRLHRLINDILDLSKIEQKRVPLHTIKFNLVELMHRIGQNLQEKVHSKKIDLILPNPDQRIELEGDHDRLQQVFTNLIDNALSYTPEKGTIQVVAEEKDGEIQISVMDNGIGIPEKELGRIFERFYRVDKGRSRNSGGTGLGLSIVKHLVESHHGHIHVESIEGKGSCFRVILPKSQT
jgi:two-component system, OmpR family, phosphate regulon sensor histidine kinase PhoR